MEILVVQHVLFEGPALIEEWAKENKFPFHCVLAESVDFYAMAPFGLLILMGGPMSVNDEEQYPWLITEKVFVKHTIKAGKLVLGICLGAQLIANCLGATVYKNKYKEIGYFPVHHQHTSSLAKTLFPEIFYPLHWHSETFDLPKGAELLASSEACKNQAFSYHNKAFGLQFHLEINQRALEKLVHHCLDEIDVQGKFQQDPQEIKERLFQYENNSILSDFMKYLVYTS
jgi:GMP synthase-like glutamine amidotransferase